ncbi:MAG: pilus assembly protein [Thermoleophilaceae bacterium]
MSRRPEAGQASVELLGAVPVVVLAGLVVLQLLAVGYAGVLAGSAAEAGALALAAGRDGPGAVRRALPGWSRARARVSVRGGRVRVRLQPPSPLRFVSRRLAVMGRADVELR